MCITQRCMHAAALPITLSNIVRVMNRAGEHITYLLRSASPNGAPHSSPRATVWPARCASALTRPSFMTALIAPSGTPALPKFLHTSTRLSTACKDDCQ